MTNWLLKWFVKDQTDLSSAQVHCTIGKMAGFCGIICNVLLFVIKLLAALAASSVSILADAFNNLSDVSSSIVTLFGFRMAQQPADKDHPYGHARYEYLSGLVVSAFILVLGLELFKSSFEKIITPAEVQFSAWTLGILLISIFIKIWMMIFYHRLGKKIQSMTLRATAADCRNDVIASTAILVGALMQSFFGLHLDGYVGLLVACFILWSGIGLAKETISPLLGKQADKALIDQISEVVLSHEKILGIHDLLVHDYGPGQCYASLHAEMSAGEDPLCCHDIIDDIEWDVLNQLQVHLLIHYDPVVENDAEKDQLQHLVQSVIEEIHPAFSMHDFRLVKGAKQTKLTFDLALPYEKMQQHRQIKEQIDEKLQQKAPGYVTVIRFDGKAE